MSLVTMKMKFSLQIFTTFFLLIISTICFSMENAVYVLHNKKPNKAAQEVLAVLADHAKSIDIIISQAYHIDQKGRVTGFIDPELLNFTDKHAKKLMALVTNAMFDKDVSHRFLSNQAAQKDAIQTILLICKKHHLYGVQFDFEMVSIRDKNALTKFYTDAAKALHQNGYVVSFAIVPAVTDKNFPSEYQRKMYENFSGAYDLKALSAQADFVTVMAYDQHIGRVTPGPNAGIRWVEKVINFALKSIPAHKISLGVPSYSRFWYTGSSSKKIILQSEAISHKTVKKLLDKHDAILRWDELDKVNYAFYNHNWLNEFIFIENAKSLKAKLELVKKYKLRGISFFRVGTEDPQVWEMLK